ncbi:MAG: efflux RND transporter periplasmic adaptor subunit, partial [Myxococcota bacterium]
MNPRKPLGVLALVAAVGAIAFPWVSDSDAAVAEASGPATKRVVVATAATARTSQTLRFSGVIRAKRDATLSFTAPGRVRQRWVEVGDRVEAGEKIAALDRRSAANRVAQAKTGVRQAKEQLAQGERDRSRADQLATERAASKVEVEAATHAVSLYEVSTDAASVELAEAQRMHRDGLLRAPFDGTIVSVASEAGEFVGAGQPVVTLS